MTAYVDPEAAALDTDEKVWEALREAHEAEMAQYLREASEEALRAEYGYYVEDAASDGEEDVMTFEEWIDSRLPDL